MDEMVFASFHQSCRFFQFLQAVFLQGDVVVVVHVVYADDTDILHRKKPLHQVRSDKAGRAGNKYGFSF